MTHQPQLIYDMCTF